VLTCSRGHACAPDTAFCGECGEDVRQRCPNGHPTEAGDRFCLTCGQTIQAPADSSTALVTGVSPAPTAPVAMPSVPAAPTMPAAPVVGQTTILPATYSQPAAQPDRAAASGPMPAASDGVAPPYHFLWRRLTRVDQITAASSAVLLISLFMPWFGAFGQTIGGINDHSYLAFALLTSITLVAYLAARAGWDRLPIRLPIAHAPLLLVGSVIQLLIVVIAFLSSPGHGVGRHYGSWIALIAALGAALPVAIPAVQSFQAPRR
jgi:hypothetical protein